jgi:hypothetical protein
MAESNQQHAPSQQANHNQPGGTLLQLPSLESSSETKAPSPVANEISTSSKDAELGPQSSLNLVTTDQTKCSASACENTCSPARWPAHVFSSCITPHTIKPSSINESRPHCLQVASSYKGERRLFAPQVTARVFSMPESYMMPLQGHESGDNSTRLHRSFDAAESADLSLYSEYSDQTGQELDRSQRVHFTPRSERRETYPMTSTPSSPESIVFVHHNKSQQLSESFLRSARSDSEGRETVRNS